MVLGNNSKQDIRLNMHPFKNDINNSAMDFEMYMKYYGMIRFNVSINTNQILNFMNEFVFMNEIVRR